MHITKAPQRILMYESTKTVALTATTAATTNGSNYANRRCSAVALCSDWRAPEALRLNLSQKSIRRLGETSLVSEWIYHARSEDPEQMAAGPTTHCLDADLSNGKGWHHCDLFNEHDFATSGRVDELATTTGPCRCHASCPARNNPSFGRG